jgi:hypothetical protein
VVRDPFAWVGRPPPSPPVPSPPDLVDTGAMAGPRCRILSGAVVVAIVALLLSGCAGSSQRFVKSSSDGVYFKIPEHWELYDEDTIVDADTALSPQEREVSKDIGWQVVFDAAPSPSLKHYGAADAEHPAGIAQVVRLTPDERDEISISSLRNLIVPVDQLLEANDGSLQVLDFEEVNEGVNRGINFVFNIRTEDGGFVTINQTTLVDDKTQELFLFVVSCKADCYVDNEDTIDKVVDSWTVKDH